MSYVMGDVVELRSFYAKNGQNSGYINGVYNNDIPSNTLIATESLTVSDDFGMESNDPNKPANITFDSPKITFDFRTATSSYPYIWIRNNGYNKAIFYNASVNFDYAAYDTSVNYIGPMEFSGTSAINITPNSNGKTLIKASTLTGTVSLDVEDGVQDGDTFSIEATDNQLVINSGEWEATPSTSGNITTYTLARVQPALPVSLKKKLRKKLALMLANLRKKRPYYCEVEYLESTGTQYINTGLLSTANSKVDIVYGFTSMESGAANNCAIFGGRNNTTTTTFTFFKLASGNPQYFRFDYNNQRSIGNASDLTWNTTSKYRFEYDGSRGTTTNITTGESAYESISPATTFTTYPICLFGVNTSGAVGQFMSGRIYKYWYTDGTNTIDLIPVLDWNMTPCMYDKISGKFFYNAGTGSFTTGHVKESLYE